MICRVERWCDRCQLSPCSHQPIGRVDGQELQRDEDNAESEPAEVRLLNPGPAPISVREWGFCFVGAFDLGMSVWLAR